jgi:hypothetical protein
MYSVTWPKHYFLNRLVIVNVCFISVVLMVLLVISLFYERLISLPWAVIGPDACLVRFSSEVFRISNSAAPEPEGSSPCL